MKRKDKEDGFRSIKGWTLLTGVVAFCRDCGQRRDFKDAVYWRKTGDRTEIVCPVCVELK